MFSIEKWKSGIQQLFGFNISEIAGEKPQSEKSASLQITYTHDESDELIGLIKLSELLVVKSKVESSYTMNDAELTSPSFDL